jgi:tRNA(adenine34) deaminase
MSEDEKWMSIAIKEAVKAEEENEVPIGAIIIKDGDIIAKAYNQPILKNDPTAHAEIQAIRIACKNQQNYRLSGCIMVVTLEPCLMCLTAMIHARINRLVFGAYDSKYGASTSLIELQFQKKFNHELIIIDGVLEKDCKIQLQSFFQKKRKTIN